MSPTTCSRARRGLIKTGLLEGEIRRDRDYPQPIWHLRIPADLWDRNHLFCDQYPTIASLLALRKQQREMDKKEKQLTKPEREEQ